MAALHFYKSRGFAQNPGDEDRVVLRLAHSDVRALEPAPDGAAPLPDSTESA